VISLGCRSPQQCAELDRPQIIFHCFGHFHQMVKMALLVKNCNGAKLNSPREAIEPRGVIFFSSLFTLHSPSTHSSGHYWPRNHCCNKPGVRGVPLPPQTAVRKNLSLAPENVPFQAIISQAATHIFLLGQSSSAPPATLSWFISWQCISANSRPASIAPSRANFIHMAHAKRN
jgi:hypothetical protein